MKTYRWEGIATATSSISHGGDTLGTITYLRRESFLTPQGRRDVPVVSGNALRGLLRDTGAKLLWTALGEPRLPVPVAHALWAGGALVKAKGQPLTGQRLADLRRMVAHVGVFGAAGGGRIIDGALMVGKLVPICAETVHLLPPLITAAEDPADLPSMHDLVQIEQYTRFPDGDRLTDVLALNSPEDAPDDDGVDLDDGLMRYGVETFVAGTRFHMLTGLTNATADEYDFYRDVLARYAQTAVVGGRIGRGHGQITFDLTLRCLDGDPPVGDWRAFGGATPAEALTALRWLD